MIEEFGHFQGRQSSDFFTNDPIEFQSDNLYIGVDATNSDNNPAHWNADKTYRLAGWREYCFTWPHLPTWRCQRGMMDRWGALVRDEENGFGKNARGYDKPK